MFNCAIYYLIIDNLISYVIQTEPLLDSFKLPGSSDITAQRVASNFRLAILQKYVKITIQVAFRIEANNDLYCFVFLFLAKMCLELLIKSCL